jgi:hypothetical protein
MMMYKHPCESRHVPLASTRIHYLDLDQTLVLFVFMQKANHQIAGRQLWQHQHVIEPSLECNQSASAIRINNREIH